jgi:hypothetical protein
VDLGATQAFWQYGSVGIVEFSGSKPSVGYDFEFSGSKLWVAFAWFLAGS